MRPVWAEINLKAIKENIKTLKALTKPGVLFMAVVKADGYGHGAVPVARAALEAGADRLGVAFTEEGVQLRQASIAEPIHVLGEASADDESIRLIVENNLIPSVCQRHVAVLLSKEAKNQDKIVKVHIKIDTGMNRLGIHAEPDTVYEFVELVAGMPNLEVEGIFTHFAMADKPQSNFTAIQIKRFTSCTNKLKQKGVKIPIKHTANSAATIAFPKTHLDMVRAGISIYGLSPSPELKEEINLKPALSLKARISFLKDVAPGQGLSYGQTFATSRKTTVATLPLGYADGYSRSLSNISEILVGGSRVKEIGTICMDQLMVDVTDVSGAKVGDEAVLIGSQARQRVTADELATLIGTINYEIVCMIGKRVERKYV